MMTLAINFCGVLFSDPMTSIRDGSGILRQYINEGVKMMIFPIDIIEGK